MRRIKNFAKPNLRKTKKGTLQIRLRKEEILKDKVAAGEWETLPLIEAFWERSPAGQVVAIHEAINNRINQMQSMLPKLLNKEQRAAYVQILDYIHELEKKRDGFTAEFFSKLGQRKISKDSKGKNYY